MLWINLIGETKMSESNYKIICDERYLKDFIAESNYKIICDECLKRINKHHTPKYGEKVGTRE